MKSFYEQTKFSLQRCAEAHLEFPTLSALVFSFLEIVFNMSNIPEALKKVGKWNVGAYRDVVIIDYNMFFLCILVDIQHPKAGELDSLLMMRRQLLAELDPYASGTLCQLTDTHRHLQGQGSIDTGFEKEHRKHHQRHHSN